MQYESVQFVFHSSHRISRRVYPQITMNLEEYIPQTNAHEVPWSNHSTFKECTHSLVLFQTTLELETGTTAIGLPIVVVLVPALPLSLLPQLPRSPEKQLGCVPTHDHLIQPFQ